MCYFVSFVTSRDEKMLRLIRLALEWLYFRSLHEVQNYQDKKTNELHAQKK